MCLYPKLIRNKRYLSNKTNKGNVPLPTDERLRWLSVGCGNCIECLKQKSRDWKVRLLEDIQHNTNGQFVTLTFAPQKLKELQNKIKNYTGYNLDNQIAKIAVKRFRERWRKQYKKSIRHWLITEIGGNNTEGLHLHGIIWTNEKKETLEKYWQYGTIWAGYNNEPTYVNEKTINYITKYVTKKDQLHKTYKPIILTSPGIGKNYIGSFNQRLNSYNGNKTNETYKTKTGNKITLSKYWKRKIYTDKEREQLMLNKLDEGITYIMGEKIKTINSQEIKQCLEYHRYKNIKEGYGSDVKDLELHEIERQKRMQKQREKIQFG